MSAHIRDRDIGWRKFFENVHTIKESYVKVGVLGDDRGAEREPGSDLTVAEIAVVQEYGTKDGHIPSRPFMRSTFDAERNNLLKLAQQLIAHVSEGKQSVARGLEILGAYLANAAKKRITAGAIPPPNAPSTALAKAKKGKAASQFRGPATLGKALGQVGAVASVKPLIDTGRLLNAITWVVITGEREK